MTPITSTKALRYEQTEKGITVSPIEETILSEYSLSVFIDGEFYQKFHCIPESLEELILGHFYTSGKINSLEDIISCSIDKEKGIANLSIRWQNRTMKPLVPNLVTPEQILPLSNKLLTTSKTFEVTGNVHSVMLCRGEEILFFSEDVDRYNAFEKTVGKALKNKTAFEETCIYTTGRIPSQIAAKAIWAGIPMIVSRSAPTNLTLQLAKDYHLTVIGFARGNRMNLYHPLPID